MSLYEAIGMLVFGFLVGRYWVPKPKMDIHLNVWDQRTQEVHRVPVHPSMN